jgi:HAD superfamily hydrolase (TIGR01549 family)
VVERFESLYLGDDQQPGSCQRERLLVDREALSRLARTMPLAIVTGRPRAQAESFLAHSEIAELFSVIVAMEDAPAKPDPAPVQRALHLLGVERAWLLGDTVDDIRAARAASVVPLGVAAAMPDNGSGLLEAGAARVLRNIDELEELLP